MPQMYSLADLGMLRPLDMMGRRLQADEQANAARTPIIQRPNLDRNATQPDDQMIYNYLKSLGLGHEGI